MSRISVGLLCTGNSCTNDDADDDREPSDIEVLLYAIVTYLMNNQVSLRIVSKSKMNMFPIWIGCKRSSILDYGRIIAIFDNKRYTRLTAQ